MTIEYDVSAMYARGKVRYNMIEIHNVIRIILDSNGRAIVTVAPEGGGKTTDIYVRPECVITIARDDTHGYLHITIE